MVLFLRETPKPLCVRPLQHYHQATMLSLKKLTFGRRRASRGGSMDLSSSLHTLETRLLEKTDLIDEMKKIVPLDVEAPGIILLGFAGSGKSTILEALTGVPLPRSAPRKAAGKMLKIRINSDPTCAKYVGGEGGREGGKRPPRGERRVERREGGREEGQAHVCVLFVA